MGLKKIDETLMLTRDQKGIANTRLQLLGLGGIADKLNKIGEIENRFRQKIIFDHQLPSLDELEVFREEFILARKDLYSSLKDSFNDLYN